MMLLRGSLVLALLVCAVVSQAPDPQAEEENLFNEEEIVANINVHTVIYSVDGKILGKVLTDELNRVIQNGNSHMMNGSSSFPSGYPGTQGVTMPTEEPEPPLPTDSLPTGQPQVSEEPGQTQAQGATPTGVPEPSGNGTNTPFRFRRDAPMPYMLKGTIEIIPLF